jgi:uncharacterized protein (TIGR02118 family)
VNKVLFIIYRKTELSHKQCLAEWSENQHVSSVKKIPGLIKWVQNHVTSFPNETASDGIGELSFEKAEALEKAMNSPEMAAAAEDAAPFLDMGKTYAMVVTEKVIVDE